MLPKNAGYRAFPYHCPDSSAASGCPFRAFAVVHSLRRQRKGMVQTLEQYFFCYEALLQEMQAAVGEVGSAAGAGALGEAGPGGAAGGQQ